MVQVKAPDQAAFRASASSRSICSMRSRIASRSALLWLPRCEYLGLFGWMRGLPDLRGPVAPSGSGALSRSSLMNCSASLRFTRHCPDAVVSNGTSRHRMCRRTVRLVFPSLTEISVVVVYRLVGNSVLAAISNSFTVYLSLDGCAHISTCAKRNIDNEGNRDSSGRRRQLSFRKLSHRRLLPPSSGRGRDAEACADVRTGRLASFGKSFLKE